MQASDALGAPGFEAIAMASLSDAGRVRAENQDAIALLENTSRERLMIVADGMGGHRGGETASRICLEAVERVFREPNGTPEERLRRSLELANEEIYSHALANPELRGMGTTAVAVLLSPDGGAWVAWIGDSRCYRLRGRTLESLTRDHSLMAEWIALGVITAEAANTHPRRHELTRALGQAPDVVVDLLAVELLPGDRLLLCSDGLHGYVQERAVAHALADGPPEDATRALVDAANESGGADNISVAVAVVSESPGPIPAPAPVPDPSAEIEALAETSFSDLGDEIPGAVAEPEAPSSPGPGPAFLLPSEQQIQIPLMMPVQPRRALDLASLAVGASAALVIVGLCIGIWSYTTKRNPPGGSVPPPPRRPVVHSTVPPPPPEIPAPPAAKPAPKPVAKPVVTPVAKPTAPPETASLPEPQIAEPETPEPTQAALPAPTPPEPAPAPSIPAAPDLSAAGPPPTATGFELTPDVEHFLSEWLAALATSDHARLEALGFSDEPAAFAGEPGSRDDFRLVTAEIDEERSQPGRVYLRLIVSYAFRDANGRFRTQDEQRFILNDATGSLRFEGRWRQ